MREFFEEHGFTESEDDSNVLEASYSYEESAQLSDALGIVDDYDTLTITVDLIEETANVSVDGDVSEIYSLEDIVEALEGE